MNCFVALGHRTPMRDFIRPVASVSQPVAQPAPAARAARAEPDSQAHGVPSGLSSVDGGEDRVPEFTQPRGQFDGLTQEKIERMSGAQYKHLVNTKGFAEFYDSLQSATAAHRGRR